MRSVSRIVLVVACAALLAAPAVTQQQKGKGGRGGFGMGGGQGFLLRNEGVQKELNLSEDQKTKVTEISDKIREKYQDDLREARQNMDFTKMGELTRKMGEETTKELASVLKPEQEKRLKQIQLQQQGLMAFQEADVQKALKLTDEQKENLKTLSDDLQKDMRDAGVAFGGFGGKGGGGKGKGKGKGAGGAEQFQENMKKREAMTKDAMDKALAQLNDTQKKEWKEMTGSPFRVEFTGFGGRGKNKKQDQE